MSDPASEAKILRPPPPPPPPADPYLKISHYVAKLKKTPPSQFYQACKPAPAVDLLAACSGPYFFYGTLTDPSLLAEILKLDETPRLRPAYILGYCCKMWGQYPALLDAPGSVVQGAAYHVRTSQDAARLAAYETGSYRVEACLIRYTDGEEPAEDLGQTFKFVGDTRDLSAGEFDLKIWLRRMGRHAAADGLEVASSEK
ncbi:gamma-glutamylcyclotransferase family protein [Aspergillus saccharolyticus JOP 1030-1]|uniref:Putative gamma-glutamylcyclotransferase n=1 Tax=Aspergillus saccharolyticus JOP 1030-1 TaxID=1450539 RepID=A0A318ZJJ4_9EURO|nr:hypothetical protein BP01DRAFT_361285 [Aspergillus saccharolyticus JOP 1030-1]PYH40438.1 hypothetical protein BP01DRAFT_361285 [Aspergillus saccharolyticus JOP 1030-1]